MSHTQTSTIALLVACCSGSAIADDGNAPMLAEYTNGNVNHVGHIYYNLGTGERIITLIDNGDRLRAETPGSDEIWVMGGYESCGDNEETDLIYVVDQFCETSMTGPCPSVVRDETLLDWGDIPTNTVVDCVRVHWAAKHIDTDLNSDGIGDGVLGLGGRWTFWDGMNGRAPQFYSIAQPVISFELYNLPGAIDPDDAGYAYYSVDVDLSGDLGSSMTFELGDDDSDLNGAAFHTSRMDLRDNDSDGIPDIDPDEDGLADWGWSVDFIQPGTRDVDNADQDSDPNTGVDGDPSALAAMGVAFGHPLPAEAQYDSIADRWEWVGTGPTAGSTEDIHNTGHINVNTGALVLDGPWYYGGFSCDEGPAGYIPFAGFEITLFGPTGIIDTCISDLNMDGYVDFLDISMFVQSQPDLNGDTFFDFLDIQIFTGAILGGGFCS